MAVFAGFTYLSPNWDIFYPILFIGVVLSVGIIIIYRRAMTIGLAVIGFVICASGLVGDSVLIKIYTPDRHHEQRVFEDAIAIAQTINERYPRLSIDDFRLWYDFDDPKVATFHAVASMYLWMNGRNIRLNQDPPPDSSFESDQIILLSSLHDKDTLLQMARDTTQNRGIITFIDELEVNNIRLVIVSIRLTLVTANYLVYHFSDLQRQYVLEESGWNGYEHVPQNTHPFRWTAEPTARLLLDVSRGQFDPTATYRVSVWVAAYLEEDVVNSLKLMLNGVPIDLIRVNNHYIGYVSGEHLIRPTLEVVFQTDRVSNPLALGIQDGRNLGVALGQLIIDVMLNHD
jgi:hypothetical protein